jgi:hypothetical protein
MTTTVMKGLTIVVSIFLTIVGIYMFILLSDIAVKYKSTRFFFGFIIIVIVGFVILLFLPTRSSSWNS